LTPCGKVTVLDSNAVDYDGGPLSVPNWSLGGDVSHGWTVADYRITAESARRSGIIAPCSTTL
jgi:hypothetical protein